MIEPLEARRFLSATLDEGVLTVIGTGLGFMLGRGRAGKG